MPKHLTVNDTGDFITADNINTPNGVAGLDEDGKVPFEHLPESASGVSSVNGQIGNVVLNAAAVGAVGNGDVGAPNGVAPLDATGKVSIAKLPSALVQSVNGYNGPSVTLAAADVGALPASGGTLGGKLTMQADGVNNLVEWKNSSGSIVARIGQNGNFVAQGTQYAVAGMQFGSTSANMGGGVGGVLGVTNATTIPNSNPSGGLVIYADAGVLKVRQSDGTVVTVANAGGGGSYLPSTGGTLTGALILNADPATALGAATKQYADVNFVSSAARLDNTHGPNDQGFLAWTCDPATTNDVGQPASGGVRLGKIVLRRAATITNLWVHVVTAGATLTAGQNFLGLYTSTGTRVGVTTDRASTWTTTGDKSAALTSPYSAAAGAYYVAILAVGTTIPNFAASSAPGTGPVNAGLTVSTGRFLTGPASQTSLPTTITMASNTMNYTSYWIAVS